MATYASWGHWEPSVICCFSSRAAAGSLGLALDRDELGKSLCAEGPHVSPFLFTALTPAFQVKKVPWDHWT